MAAVVFAGSMPTELFSKNLSKEDLERFYIPNREVSKIYPAALAFDSPNEIELFFYDSERTRWTMTLRKAAGNRWRLSGEWRQFAERWEFNEGQEISFFEYTCTTGATFFLIRRRAREPFYFFV